MFPDPFKVSATIILSQGRCHKGRRKRIFGIPLDCKPGSHPIMGYRERQVEEMNIAEVERRTGLTRANIRFYEKEGLLSPARGANGYRDYTEADVETLRKVRLLL